MAESEVVLLASTTKRVIIFKFSIPRTFSKKRETYKLVKFRLWDTENAQGENYPTVNSENLTIFDNILPDSIIKSYNSHEEVSRPIFSVDSKRHQILFYRKYHKKPATNLTQTVRVLNACSKCMIFLYCVINRSETMKPIIILLL